MQLVFLSLFSISFLFAAGTASAASPPPEPWGIDVAAFANFSACKSSPATKGKLIVISRRVTSNSLTIPADRAIKVVKGGSIEVETGSTLYINGAFTAGTFKVFTGKGSVSFGLGSVSAVYPQWWGAESDGIHDDSYAVQSAVSAAERCNGRVHLIAGSYYIPSTIRTSNEILHFTRQKTTSLVISGDGKGTILIGRGAKPATYNQMGVNPANESVIAIHKSNVIIKSLQIRESPVGIYLGQDPRSWLSDTRGHLNRFQDLWIQNVGTGILLQPGKDNFYNVFERIQFQGFQIGFHYGLPFYTDHIPVLKGEELFTYVNNRNTIRSCYFNNGWVGILLQNGDTGVIDACNFESINGDPSGIGAIGPIPSQVHDSQPKATAIHVDNSSHTYGISGYKVTNCHAEANSRDIHLEGSGWGFVNNEFDISKIHIKPGTILGSYISNGDPYENRRWAGFHYDVLHIKQAWDFVDPFLPNVPAGMANRGIFIDEGLISDTGKRREKAKVSSAEQILAISPESTSVYWQLGGVREWWAKITWTKKSSYDRKTPVSFLLPDGKPADPFFSQFHFPASVRSGKGEWETISAFFTTSGKEITLLSPSYGWSDDALDNHIQFSLRWY